MDMRVPQRSGGSGSADRVVPALAARDLRKGFRTARGTVTALDGVNVSIDPGQLLILLGPSGCGKTTLLRCMAGLETPDTGEVDVNGTTVSSPATGIAVPPEQRHLGMMFQSYALWPHMSVFDNIAYPLRNREKLDRTALSARVFAILDDVGLKGLDERYPSELSGGQQQRVALARALVASPAALLFDEPLSNVDAQVRRRLRTLIREMKEVRGFAGAYVTHDQEEAMVLADVLAVMKDGMIVQSGPPAEIYRRPASLYVANFVGEANTLAGRVARVDSGGFSVDTALGPLVLEGSSARPSVGDEGHVVIRPEVVQLDRSGLGVNDVNAVVAEIVMLGPLLEIGLQAGATRLRAWENSFAARALGRGDAVALHLAPTNISWVRE